MRKKFIALGMAMFFAGMLSFSCVFPVQASETGQKTEQRAEPLPLEEDTTVGEIVQHFEGETYEEMPEELKEQYDRKKVKQPLLGFGISNGKRIMAVFLICMVFLFFALAGRRKK